MNIRNSIQNIFRGSAYKLLPKATNLISILARNENFRHDFVTAFNIAQRNARMAEMAYQEISLKEGGSVYKSAYTVLKLMFSQANLYMKMEHCSLKEAWYGVIDIELGRHDLGFDL